ncbi:hypothetical protein ANCDUO_26339 [Ancylostoma duodenale]|uniref:Uncharacterized protein n=1 Tax=Ancylostoma duodenale TaxID=51022 RepID=A0A0C2F530_9BILA|nr:hypothetical protein ANCDUO_26339 [Ancylostoma duodenale]
MEIVKTLIKPHDNFTLDDDRQIPESRIWIKGQLRRNTYAEIDTLYASFLTLGSLFTVVVVCLAAVQLYYVIKYVSNARIQADLYYLALMFPVSSRKFTDLKINF